jgi:hypothetical protein
MSREIDKRPWQWEEMKVTRNCGPRDQVPILDEMAKAVLTFKGKTDRMNSIGLARPPIPNFI